MVYEFSNLGKTFSSQVAGLIPQSNKFTPSKNVLSMLCKTYDSDPTLKKKGILYSLCAEFRGWIFLCLFLHKKF
ncbi:MAG: hypothetical protein J6A54_05355 [Clostridia bacterium]|nr:hypothetical protein [Clostridia bacterium]